MTEDDFERIAKNLGNLQQRWKPLAVADDRVDPAPCCHSLHSLLCFSKARLPAVGSDGHWSAPWLSVEKFFKVDKPVQHKTAQCRDGKQNHQRGGNYR